MVEQKDIPNNSLHTKKWNEPNEQAWTEVSLVRETAPDRLKNIRKIKVWIMKNQTKKNEFPLW